MVAGETPSLIGELIGETHRVLECAQAHPLRNHYQRGPICLWVAGEVTESQQRAEQGTVPLCTPPPHTASQRSDVGCPALVNT